MKEKGKMILGIVLVVLAAALLVTAVVSVAENMAHSGPIAGKINSYKPPFPGHGLLVIAAGVAAAVSLLGGIVLIRLGQQ